MLKNKNVVEIELSVFGDDNFKCPVCGNYAESSGFFPCNEDGKEIEPTEEAGWEDLYVCAECDTIYKVKE